VDRDKDSGSPEVRCDDTRHRILGTYGRGYRGALVPLGALIQEITRLWCWSVPLATLCSSVLLVLW
jgi:hypothetical protein